MRANKVTDALGPGTFYYADYWDDMAQNGILAALGEIIAAAPLFVPRMPRTGQPWAGRSGAAKPALCACIAEMFLCLAGRRG